MNNNINWSKVRNKLTAVSEEIAKSIERSSETNWFLCFWLQNCPETLEVFQKFFEVDRDSDDICTFNCKIYGPRWNPASETEFVNQVRLMAIAILIEYADMMANTSEKP